MSDFLDMSAGYTSKKQLPTLYNICLPVAIIILQMNYDKGITNGETKQVTLQACDIKTTLHQSRFNMVGQG